MSRAFQIAGVLLLMFSWTVAAEDANSFAIEGVYGLSSVSPSGLNTARSDFLWNNNTPTNGSFNDLNYWAFSIGYKLFDPVYIYLRYESDGQVLGNTSISGTSYSVRDSFVYQPLFLLADYPFDLGDGWGVSIRGGVGYALKYQFHDKESGGNAEDVTWQGNPLAFRLGGTFSYAFFTNFGAYAELYYESVKSSLKAAQNYNTTVNGVPISSGQMLKNAQNGSDVTADMSGFHYGLGLRLMF